jgi:hypothetical protein
MRVEKTDNSLADEDFAEHERTFRFFLRVAGVAVLHIAACLIAVAIGGIFGHWDVALLVFLIATLAAAIGISSERLAWRPGAAVLAMSLVTFAVTA